MCENRFLYANEYRDQKMGGKNARNKFFTYTRKVQAKNVGKKSSVKGGKNVFYIHTYIVTKKWGERNARSKFSRNKRLVQAKNGGKNRRNKVRKTFFYSHEYRDQKIWGKKRAKQFFQKHTNSARKKCWEKIF